MNIVICGNCEGHGSLTVREMDGYTEHQCNKCRGKGRVMKRTYTIEMPYGTKTQEYLDTDRQISELIRNLNKSNL